MATKKTSAAEAQTPFEAFAVNNDAMKEGMEKFVKGFGEAGAFSKEAFDAVVASASATTKNLEALNSEAISFSKQQMEDGVAAAKAAFTSRSLQELMEVNSDYTKSAFDAYVGQLNKMSDMMVAAAKDAAEPINERVTNFVELVQSYRP